MQDREATEEHTIGGHGLQHARRHEDNQVEKPKRRDRDTGSDDLGANGSEQVVHRIRCWRRTPRQSFDPEYAQVREVGQQIDGDHDRDADDESLREIPFRLDDLLGNKVGLLPATICKENRNKGSSDCSDGRSDGKGRYRTVGDGRGNCKNSNSDEHR